MPFKLLIVEDELEIKMGLKTYLEAAKYIVELASDGVEAMIKLQQEEYDLIILDVMLPIMDGYEVLEKIREQSDVPVVMLTALNTNEAQMRGFNLKIDDYITKPFAMNIVVKRIEAILRRATKVEKESQLFYKEISLNLDSCEVFVAQRKVMLTHKEFEVIKLFLENPNYVFTRDHLLNKIWGLDFYGNEKLVNVHIKNIRKKIGLDYIQTVRGMGYKLASEN